MWQCSLYNFTGRYGFNMGMGKMVPFHTYSIASMPLGLPTIGNLLKDYANYDTYFVGKWHVGYAVEEMYVIIGVFILLITFCDKKMLAVFLECW